MRRFRPSPAFVVACVALLLAAGGTSVAAVRATAGAVNVVDPVIPSQIARVDSLVGSVSATAAAG